MIRFTVEHLALAAHHPVALKDWYVKVLGAEVVFRMPQDPPAFLIKVAGLLIEIYQARTDSEATRDNGVGGWRHLALKVDSLESAENHLVEKGVKIEPPIKPAGGGGRVLFFRDGEGNLLHLVERLPEGYR